MRVLAYGEIRSDASSLGRAVNSSRPEPRTVGQERGVQPHRLPPAPQEDPGPGPRQFYGPCCGAEEEAPGDCKGPSRPLGHDVAIIWALRVAGPALSCMPLDLSFPAVALPGMMQAGGRHLCPHVPAVSRAFPEVTIPLAAEQGWQTLPMPLGDIHGPPSPQEQAALNRHPWQMPHYKV